MNKRELLALHKKIRLMPDEQVRLNDDECSELIDLYRIARADNATSQEINRLQELVVRSNESNKRKLKSVRRKSR